MCKTNLTRLVPILIVNAVLFVGSSASAESPDGWIATGPAELVFSQKTIDGRVFTFGIRDAQKKGQPSISGCIMSLYRPSRPPLRTVVPASELREFSDEALAKYRGTTLRGFGFGDLIPNWIPDWAKRAFDFVKGIVKKLSKIYAASKTLIEAIMKDFSEFSGVVSEELLGKESANAVADYTLAIQRSVEAAPTGSLAKRVHGAFVIAINRPSRSQALADAIVRYSK